MSHWRPVKNCIFVIPDIHGANQLLHKILDRILPLRNYKNCKDYIIFLGDYIDRHEDSHLVLDTLISLKKDYPEQVICLMGNHEYMAMGACGIIPSVRPNQLYSYDMKHWIENGGDATLRGYLKRADIKCNPEDLVPSRAAQIIPKEHWDFLKSLPYYYETDDYIFVHGGFNPDKHPKTQSLESVVWNRSLFTSTLTAIKNKESLNYPKVIVTGHNYGYKFSLPYKPPIISVDYMMLDCGSPETLLVVELNTLEAYMSYPNQSRMVKYKLKETVF